MEIVQKLIPVMGEKALEAVSVSAPTVPTKSMDRIMIGIAVVIIVVVLVVMFTTNTAKKDEQKSDYSPSYQQYKP